MREPPRALSEEGRRDLLTLARRTLEAHFQGEPPPRLASDRAETFGEARGATAPAELRAAVIAGWQQTEQTLKHGTGENIAKPAESTSDAGRPAVAGRIGSSSAITAPRSSLRANIFAVAASLLLVAGAVLFGIYTPSIDHWRTGDNNGIETTQHEIAQLLSEAHIKCAYDSDVRQQQLIFRAADGAASHLAQLFQQPLSALDLSTAGYSFIAGGDCPLSATDPRPAGHLIFQRQVEGRPAVFASIFLVPVTYGIAIDATLDHWSDAAPLDQCRTVVMHRRGHRFIYFLTSCDANDIELLAAVLDQQLFDSGR